MPKREPLVIEPDVASREINAWGGDRGRYLSELLGTAKARAWAPITGFQVGASALGASGAVYLGFNIEPEHGPLPATVHAEQCAVALAADRHDRIVALATSAPPCGHCRHFLARHAPTVRLFPGPPDDLREALPIPPSPTPNPGELDRIRRLVSGRALRPQSEPVGRIAFGEAAKVWSGGAATTVRGVSAGPSSDLHAGPLAAALAWAREVSGGPPERVSLEGPPSGWDRQVAFEWAPDLEIETQAARGRPIAFLPEPFGPHQLGIESSPFPARPWSGAVEASAPLDYAAVSAARRSWAPMTGSAAGLVLETRSDFVAASLLESVALNPSLSPLAAALVLLGARGLDPEDVVAVVLAESTSAKVRYAESTQARVALDMPRARFRLVPVTLTAPDDQARS